MSLYSNIKTYGMSDADKYLQFAWRSSKKQSGDKTDTLIGNWNEERYDLRYLAKAKTLPSQYNHYFETTNKKSFTTEKKIENLPAHVNLLGGQQCEARTFPRHQPELDVIEFKQHYNKFESNSMASYKDPTKFSATSKKSS